MKIEIPFVNIVHSDEDSAITAKLELHDSGESLFINAVNEDKSFAIILDKPELLQLRNALTCYLESNLIEDFEHDED